MLGRLLKYEWKSSGKITLLLNAYIILITLGGFIMIKSGFFNAMMNRQTASQEEFSLLTLIGMLLITAYFISIIAVAIAVVLFQIFRFYKNYYTDEGYLMHTLPVSSTQLILSKGLFAFGAIVLTCVILMASAFLLVLTAAPVAERQDIIEAFSMLLPMLSKELGWPPALLILYMVALTILSTAHSILAFYAALSIGQRFARHKIIGAILAYVIMNMAEQISSVIFMFLSGWNSMMASQNSVGAIRFVRKSFYLSFIMTLIITVIYWVITNYMMKKRLNLE